METLSPAQPLSHDLQTGRVMSTPASQPAPDNADQYSHPSAAGSKPHLAYKCLLNQYAQKLKKPPPVYQTQNEGSEHQPRFRSTVWVNGVSYTSSSTFQHRKMAELDVSKVAYNTITQKAKSDALHFIQQDNTFCKSVMAEFAAKKNIGRPVYETTQLEAQFPVFRSCLIFNGGRHQGDGAKSKKEAEQLVARSVIIKLLASESGTDMVDIVNCKIRKYHEINSIQIGPNVSGGQVVVGHNIALTESGTSTMARGTTTLPSSSSVPTQQISTEPITRVAPLVNQPPTQQVSTEPFNPVVPLETQLPTPQVSTVSSLIQGTMVPATFPSLGVSQSIIPQLSVERIIPTIQPPARQVSTGLINPIVPLVTQPPTPHVSTDPIHPVVPVPVVTQQPTPQAKAEPLVSTLFPSAVVNNSRTPMVSAPLVEIPATANVSQQPKTEASSTQAAEYIPLVDQSSGKKRSRTSRGRRNAQKKMGADT